MKNPFRLGSILLVSAALSGTLLAQKIVVLGVPTSDMCVFATKPLIQDLKGIGFPKDWTIAVACPPAVWERLQRKRDDFNTVTAFTNLKSRFTVLNGTIDLQPLPLRATNHWTPRSVLEQERGPILCNCADEANADKAGETNEGLGSACRVAGHTDSGELAIVCRETASGTCYRRSASGVSTSDLGLLRLMPSAFSQLTQATSPVCATHAPTGPADPAAQTNPKAAYTQFCSSCETNGEQTVARGHELVPAETPNKLPFGNLRKLLLKGTSHQYSLNGFPLARLPDGSIYLSTPDQHYQVQVTFFKTVLISKTRPIDRKNKALLQSWAKDIPLVRQILDGWDSIGSLKPVRYSLIEPTGQKNVQLQEELVYLWSSDPRDSGRIGDTSLMPPVDFSGQITDIQYRGVRQSAGEWFGKIVLQILYIKDQSKPALLGGFVIVSKPNGEYEPYWVPMELLRNIVLEGG